MRLQVTEIFERVWDAQDKKVISLRGSSRSSKTYSVIQYIILKCLQETNNVFSIVRKTSPSLRATVLRDFKEVMMKMDLWEDENYRKIENTYNLNGNLIEFFSLDESSKVRGRSRDYLFINEATEFDYEEYSQLAIRTRKKPIVLDYNPSIQGDSWIYQLEEEETTEFIHSTYLDNPFLPQEVIDQIERLKETDENLWRIYGLGEKGVATSNIFTTYKIVDNIPSEAIFLGYGSDFGFQNPTTLVGVYQFKDELFLQERLYVTQHTTNDIIYKMDKMGIDKTDYIFADSASPQNIEEIRRAGYNIRPVKKDNVMYSLDLMKRYKLRILKDSKNLIYEFENYRYKTDKDGNNLEVPDPKHDHAIDAARYCIMSQLQPSKLNGSKFIFV